jgi:hypothetical protein
MLNVLAECKLISVCVSDHVYVYVWVCDSECACVCMNCETLIGVYCPSQILICLGKSYIQ